jgi:DNA topoisomerase-2
MVEPVHFVPILPLVLLNGCEGIGTGWMTSVPQYNPRELCEILKNKIKGESFTDELIPWYKGFSGDIQWALN